MQAFHEAGHLVAASLRGLSWQVPVSLEHGTHADGMLWWRAEPRDRAFIVFAGPWAQARHSWGDRPLEDGDADFAGEVAAVLRSLPADDDALRHAAAAYAGVRADWTAELERLWPAVRQVAALLIQDAVTHVQTQAALDAASKS